VIGEIIRVKAYLGEYLRHLAQEIKRFAVGFLQVNPQTMQRNDGVVGESATTLRGGGFASTTNSILANRTAFFVKREIFDMDIGGFPLHLPSSDEPSRRRLAIHQSL